MKIKFDAKVLSAALALLFVGDLYTMHNAPAPTAPVAAPRKPNRPAPQPPVRTTSLPSTSSKSGSISLNETQSLSLNQPTQTPVPSVSQPVAAQGSGKKQNENFVTRAFDGLSRKINSVGKTVGESVSNKFAIKLPEIKIKENATQVNLLTNIGQLDKYVESKKTELTDGDRKEFTKKTDQIRQAADLLPENQKTQKAQIEARLATLERNLTQMETRAKSQAETQKLARQVGQENFAKFLEKKQEKDGRTVAKTVSVPVGLKRVEGKILPKVVTKQVALPQVALPNFINKSTLPKIETNRYADVKKGEVRVDAIVKDFNDVSSRKTPSPADAAKLVKHIDAINLRLDAAIGTLKTKLEGAREVKARLIPLETKPGKNNPVTAIQNMLTDRKNTAEAKAVNKAVEKLENDLLTTQVIKENYTRQKENLSSSAPVSWTAENPRISLSVVDSSKPYSKLVDVRTDLQAIRNLSGDAPLYSKLYERIENKVEKMTSVTGKYLTDTGFKDDVKIFTEIKKTNDGFKSTDYTQDAYGSVLSKMAENIEKRMNNSNFKGKELREQQVMIENYVKENPTKPKSAVAESNLIEAASTEA